MADANKIPRPQSDFGVGECFEYIYEYILRAHWIHINTDSFECHKTTEFLYKELSKKVDTVLEVIAGYAPKEKKLSINLTLECNPDAPKKLVNDLWDYADRYEKIFAKLGYGDLENLLQEIKSIASHSKYLLTLK